MAVRVVAWLCCAMTGLGLGLHIWAGAIITGCLAAALLWAASRADD